MPSYVNAYDAICQSCGSRFNLRETFSATINLDIEGFEKQGFLNGTLNKVTCPFCACKFTYEIPMIVFSSKLKIAYLVQPTLRNDENCISKNPPYAIFSKDYEYRIVRYLAEAKEKFDIKMSGLSDSAVEYIKLKSFTDDMAMPFDELNMLFVSYENKKYIFNQVDYNDKILNTYEITFSENIPEYVLNISRKNNKWLKIDRETLKEEVKCQNIKMSL